MALLLVSLCGSAKAQSDSAFVAQHYTKKEVLIPMRDGVKLFTAIYIPNDVSEKHPILMMRTPYSVAPYGETRISPRLYGTHWVNYAKENYIVVMQDVRGRYMSEGDFVDVRPFKAGIKAKKQVDEASDTYDTIDWLIKNTKGNNGRVGVFGISYPGFYSTMAALSNHPALKAVSPQAPVTDWFIGDDFHHNGAFALMDAFGFYSGFGKYRPTPTTQSRKGFSFPEKDGYAFYLKQGAIKNLTRHMDSVAFWNDLMAHPNYDDWWKARDARRACYDVKPAMLVVGGTFDAEDCFGAWNLYKAIEKQSPQTNNKLVMGPWFHGGWARGSGANLGAVRFGSKTSLHYQSEMEVPFFNYYLKDKGTGNWPEARVFFSGENSWRDFSAWPPVKMKQTPVYLGNNQSLEWAPPAGNLPPATYLSLPDKPVPYSTSIQTSHTREYMSDDQRFAANRPDVLVFETPVLEKDLTLAGPVVADLKVSLSSSDADFVVKLIDVFPADFVYADNYCCNDTKHNAEMGGYQMLVRGEIMRGKYRNSFEKPEPFVPGKIETVKFELPDVAHTFKKGHKIMVQIQSSWFPLFDRNPQVFTNIYTCNDADFVPCAIQVFRQADAASAIVLPVLED